LSHVIGLHLYCETERRRTEAFMTNSIVIIWALGRM
jgi:hypothetical protein